MIQKNPADLASRGKSMDETVANDFWWHGFKWLQYPKES